MKLFLFSGFSWIFFTLCGVILFSTKSAEAVSWQWSTFSGRERVTITFDTPHQGKTVSRVNTTQLVLPLTVAPANFSRINGAPPAESLVSGVSVDGTKLYIQLRDAAFGYVTTVTKSDQIAIDIFSDPLGNRWRNLGAPAPASAPSRASSALPEVPEVPKQITPSETKQTVKTQNNIGNVQGAPKDTAQPNDRPKSIETPNKDTPKPTDTPSVSSIEKTKEKQTSKEGIVDKVGSPISTVPPPSVDELTKITNKIDQLHPQSNEYTWSEDKGKKSIPVEQESTTDKSSKGEPLSVIPIEDTPDTEKKAETAKTTEAAPIPIKPPKEDASINSIRSQINTQGPNAWPQEKALTTMDKLEAFFKKEETQEQSGLTDTIQPLPTDDKKVQPEPAVVYVDEKGNPVDKPPDSLAMIDEAKQSIGMMQFEKAKELLEQVKKHTLLPEQQEDVLYLLSEVNEKMYKGKWVEGYEPIVASTNEAMNFNLRSPRVAEALMRLGMINIMTGNLDEAEGYLGALRRKFPQNPLVPEGYLALGKEQFSKGQYAEAVKTFQLIMDNYPESRAVQGAARFMAEALFRQGHYNRALLIVDFVDRRWPRLYLEDPDYLTMVGDLYARENRLDDALKSYWTYYNLTPKAKNNHEIFFKIGNLYLKKGLLKGGKDVFEELLKKYPKSESAPKALLALGEERITKDNPTISELVTIFENPSSTIPEIYYKKILDEYPDSPEAQKAIIRLAAWKLWHRDIPTAMTMAQQFLDKYPESPYAPRAEDIILRGFDQAFTLALQEENYERILSLWEKYPYIQMKYKDMKDELRVALARAYLNRGDEAKGMDMLAHFLESPQDPNYGDYVYNLYLAHYLRKENWSKILELGEKVATWKLPTSSRTQLDYAMAIAAENLGLGDKALPLWKSLYKRDDIPLYQKAYATYFMARDAERRRDLDAAYKLNLNTLKLFITLEEEGSDKADPERVRESLAALMDVTEVANRFAESLEWAEQYAAFVPETSPDYAGLLFRKARLHRKMGDLDNWKQLLDKIVQREPESVFGRMAASELRTYEVSRDLTRFTQ